MYGMAPSSCCPTKEATVSEANSDQNAKPDKSAKPASSRPASSPDELVEDLDIKVTEELGSKVRGGLVNEKIGPDFV
jgi:hypothetical protein